MKIANIVFLFSLSHLLLPSLIFFLFPLLLYAQTKDAGLWTGIAVKKKISQQFEISVAEKLRFNENITELGTFFTHAGATWRFNPDLRISANYRFINKKQVEDYYSIRHRYYFDLNYRKKFNKITPAARVRFQSQYADVFSSNDGTIPEWYVRPKISLRCNLKGPWNPFVFSELFYHFSKKEFDNVRFSAGVERNLGSKWNAEFSFMHQREFNVNRPEHDYIFMLEFAYSL